MILKRDYVNERLNLCRANSADPVDYVHLRQDAGDDIACRAGRAMIAKWLGVGVSDIVPIVATDIHDAANL